MANSRIKASVHVDESPEKADWVHGIELLLSADQAAEVLRAVITGATLSVNLVTPANHAGIGNTAEKFDYSQ